MVPTDEPFADASNPHISTGILPVIELLAPPVTEGQLDIIARKALDEAKASGITEEDARELAKNAKKLAIEQAIENTMSNVTRELNALSVHYQNNVKQSITGAEAAAFSGAKSFERYFSKIAVFVEKREAHPLALMGLRQLAQELGIPLNEKMLTALAHSEELLNELHARARHNIRDNPTTIDDVRDLFISEEGAIYPRSYDRPRNNRLTLEHTPKNYMQQMVEAGVEPVVAYLQAMKFELSLRRIRRNMLRFDPTIANPIDYLAAKVEGALHRKKKHYIPPTNKTRQYLKGWHQEVLTKLFGVRDPDEVHTAVQEVIQSVILPPVENGKRQLPPPEVAKLAVGMQDLADAFGTRDGVTHGMRYDVTRFFAFSRLYENSRGEDRLLLNKAFYELFRKLGISKFPILPDHGSASGLELVGYRTPLRKPNPPVLINEHHLEALRLKTLLARPPGKDGDPGGLSVRDFVRHRKFDEEMGVSSGRLHTWSNRERERHAPEPVLSETDQRIAFARQMASLHQRSFHTAEVAAADMLALLEAMQNSKTSFYIQDELKNTLYQIVEICRSETGAAKVSKYHHSMRELREANDTIHLLSQAESYLDFAAITMPPLRALLQKASSQIRAGLEDYEEFSSKTSDLPIAQKCTSVLKRFERITRNEEQLAQGKLGKSIQANVTAGSLRR